MTTLLSLMWSTSLTGGAVAAVALLCLPLTRRFFSAGWHRTVLCAVLGFFLLPVGAVLSPLLSLIGAASGTTQPLPALELPAPLEGLTFAPAVVETSWWWELWQVTQPLLPVVWLAVALVLLTYRMLQLARFQNHIRRTSTEARGWMADILGQAQATLHLSGKVTLLENPFVDTPMLTNLGRTVLVIPQMEWGREELYLVFCHELTHLKQRDLWVKWVAGMLCIVHWFNPLVYLVAGQLNHWMELSCDAQVVRDMDGGQRRKYAGTILEVLSRVQGRQSGVCVALCESKKKMKARLKAMLTAKTPSGKNRLAAGLILVLVCAGGLLMGAAGYQPVVEVENLQEVEDISPELEIYDQPLESVGHAPTQLLWPTISGVKTSTFQNHSGNGVDFLAPEDTDIYAAAAGIVVKAEEGYTGYGHYLLVDHGGGYQTLYGHCNSLEVAVGDVVEPGQVIAKVGRTGWSTGYHLHFEVRRNGSYENALDYVNSDNSPMDWPQA